MKSAAFDYNIFRFNVTETHLFFTFTAAAFSYNSDTELSLQG